MPLNHTPNLAELIANKNLEAIREIAIPVTREQNHSQSWRSALMLSTHNLKHLLKIPTLGAECIMLNLEDGVSVEQKPFALALCALALASNPKLNKKIVVRVNPLDEGGAHEIAYLNPFMPDAIRVPKIRTRDEVERVLELVDPNIEVHLSIETKEAWLALSSLACDSRIKAFYLGVLDFFADLGLSQSLLQPQNPLSHYLLSHFLITSRACGVKPVSFVYQEYKNLEGMKEWLKLEKTLGFDAKGCITPDQATLIHDVLGNSASEIARCEEIIRLFEENQVRGISGFVDERYGFIDEPIYKGALAVARK